MAIRTKPVLTSAVFLSFSIFAAGDLVAQGTGRGGGQTTMGTGVAGTPGVTARSRRGPLPLKFEVQIDAMAFIDEWREAQRNSQIGTPRRSGVRINGTPVGAGGGGREVLFACTGNAFLDLTVGVQQPDGSVLIDEGPSVGCDPRQALVRNGDRLSCNWYTPPVGLARASAPDFDAEIRLATVPPVSIVGQCITGSATVEPALVFPEARTRRVGTRPRCGGSGVTINGRATGQSANCLR